MKALLLAITVAGLVLTASGSCPQELYYGPLACAVQPHCFGDSMCGAGERCCPHTCGARCVVDCPAVHCGSKVCREHGFDTDSRGCPTCDCRTKAPCHSLSCLFQGTVLG